MGRILLVDDDKVNSSLIVNKLQMAGNSVVHAPEGETALAEFSEQFDFIILDIMIPRIDGVTLLSHLKKGINKNTPVFIYTNLISDEKKQECLTLGAADYILKVDVTPQQLTDRILAKLPTTSTAESRNQSENLPYGPI
ncbi:response regulator transcription factor [Candidatus Roizmanbacteria bacterium]|nr:response regulator transcription factor [Candidatus Roizmanbacteria bacterium]